MNPFEGRQMLREPQACELLGLLPGQLNRLIRLGMRIPYYSIGDRAKCFDKRELEQWWESRKVNGSKKPAAPTVVEPKPAVGAKEPTEWLKVRTPTK